MPELPEVETVRCQLQKALPGRRFESVTEVDPFVLRDVSPEAVSASLGGRVVRRVDRAGKFLVLPLSGGTFLTVHLGMTGNLLMTDPAEAFTHVRFAALMDDGRRLVFRDVRKFGRVHVTEGGPAERINRLGPDAWLGDWGPDYLAARLEGRTGALKAFLLDQRNLAGIGNIYADEILFGARLSPVRPAGRLTRGEVERLAVEIKERLAEGVLARGCTVSDFVDSEGRPGTFQESLRAYGRHGLPCVSCGGPLARIVVAGRGTIFCAVCQS
ncbi:MAG: bifunctional DNA-formamidopyrimidine glycosylase/DNA-(apurinic or apyrimidinic site) lyase [Actinobacteria bacterium]|nr:bifunctional DNA-formamidopyrimidine glycosylase/DNA-(apurinic or apyrimidinic site) lyase [Actinomycetota bacterium]